MSLLRIKQADGSWSNIPAIKGADGIDGKDGAVQYTAGRYIQIDENTNTINCTVKIGDLVIIDAVPVKDSTNVVSSGGVYDALEAKADKTEIAGLGGEAGFITNSVEDLKNYYKKSETYSQEEVNSLLGNLTRLTLQVVQELPEVGTEHIIYLVPNNESGNNVYEEWIFIQSKWEMIGTTEVDLSNYYTKEEIDNLLQALSGSSNNMKGVYVLDIPDFIAERSYNTYYSKEQYPDMITTFENAINKAVSDGCKRPILIVNGSSRTYIFECKDYDITSQAYNLHFTTMLNTNNENAIGTTTYVVNSNMYFSGSWTDGVYTLSGLGASRGEMQMFKNTDVLLRNNTSSYTPTGDYNPATKKYVDDAVANAGAGGGDNEFPMQEDLDIHIVKSDFGGSNPYWADASSDVVVKFMEKLTELYKKGPHVRRIRITTNSNPSVYWECRVGFNGTSPSIEPVMTFVYDGEGNITQRRKANFMYGTFYYDTESESFKHSGGNAIAFFTTAGDPGIYAKAGEVLTKTNANVFTPTGDYNPATKKYVDDAVANAGAGGEGTDLSNYYTKEEIDALIPEEDELTRIPYIMVSYSLNNSDSIRELGKLFTNHYKKHNNINTLVFGMVDFNASYTKIFRWKGNGTGEGGRPTEVTFICLDIYSANIGSMGIAEYKWRFSFDADGNISVGSPTITSIDYISRSFLAKDNAISFTPTGDYNPATKKYVDDAVAAAGGGSGGVKESPIIDLNINASLLSGNLNITDEEILGKVSDAFTKYNKGEISLPIFNVMGSLTSIPQLIFIHEAQPTTTPLNGNIRYTGYAIHSVVGTLRAYVTILSLTVSSDSDNNCTVSSMTFVNSANGKVLLTPENTSSYTPTADYHPATKKYVDEAVANAGGGETPDLTAYAKLTDVLSKTNTTEYTPASAYHPATKQYVDQAVAGAGGGITEESDPTVPLHVKNITQDMITKWNTVEDKLTKDELSTSASEAGLVTIDSINYPIVIKGRYNVDVVKYSGSETVTPQILDYTIDESAMPFINAALKRFLKIKQDTGQSLIYTDSSFGDYTMVYMPLDISLLVELLKDATIEYNDYDDANNSYTKTTAINSDDIKAFTPSIANNLDGHRAVLSVMHYFNEQYQSFDDIKITFKEIYSDYNRKDISLRISSKINYNSEYDFELHTLSLSLNTALHIDKGTGTVIPTSTNDLNNNSGFITSDDLPEPLVIEGVIDETYGKGNRILNPGKGSYSSINKPNENAFAIGEFSTSAGFNTVAYGSGALAEGYNVNSRIICSSGQGSGKEFTFKGVGNSSHIRVGSKIYNDKLKKAFTVTEVTEYESGEITYRNIKIKRDSQDEDVFSGNNYIINAGSIATHSEGMECQALGNCSHAEGSRAVATGYASHAQNDATTSNGIYSHAGGLWSEANAECSIAHGRTLTNNVALSALFGKYATLDAEADADVVFAIGNGNSYDDQNIGLKLVGAKGEGKLYVENTLMGADPSTYEGFDNTKTQVLKHINGVFTWVDE